MIVPPSISSRLMQNLTNESGVKKNLPAGAISKIPWRKADVRYVTNEIYFDIIESIDCVFNPNMQLVYSTIRGEIQANSRLSGVPDLTLSFHNAPVLDGAALHRCVRINRSIRERVVSFVPPDGPFQLLSYKTQGPQQMPLTVKPTIEFRKGGCRVHVSVSGGHSQGKPVTDIVVIIPFPKSIITTSLTCNTGTVHHDDKTKVTRWELSKLPTDRTALLEGSVALGPDDLPDEAPTVRVEFQCKMYSASGLKVDGLAIRAVNYKPFKGVRSITKHGHFQIRTG